MKSILNSQASKAINLVLICFFFHLYCQAQSLPSDAFVSMKASSTPGMVNGNYYVEVVDTTDVYQIEIKLGTSWSATEYVNQVFDFDVTSGLPSGFSYSRTGNLIKIEIGEYAANAAYYGEVRIKNGSGTWGSIYQFVAN